MTQTKHLGSVDNADKHQDKPAGLPCSDSSASFWHSQPNTFLLGHRTTSELPAKADIVIVGSGITGASAARYLAEDKRTSGLSILMLEAREVCWGATGRNGGHCQPLLIDRSADVAEFEVRNVNEVRSYIEENNIECEFRTIAGCRTYWTAELFDDAKADVEALRKTHPDMGKLVTVTNDPEDLKAHRVKPDCKGIMLTQGAGQLWPYKYVTFIVERLVKDGKINVQTQTPVTRLVGKTVETPRGNVQAGEIILATNGYTSHLLPEYKSLIVPVRCEMSALHPPNQERLANSYGMVAFQNGNPEHDDYLVQRPFYDGRGGHLMFGGGRDFAMYDCVGISDDDIVDPGEADYLRRALPQMLELGSDDELKASHQWTGIKGYSRDNMPWVGRVRRGIWLCAGYTGHGMPNATLCAKAVVDMLLSGDDYEDTWKRLIEESKLPASYLLTADRLSKAEALPSVWMQDILLASHIQNS